MHRLKLLLMASPPWSCRWPPAPSRARHLRFGHAPGMHRLKLLLMAPPPWSCRWPPAPSRARHLRSTLLCAADKGPEKSFKKTIEVDRLIDMLRNANPRELDEIVVENILAFDEGLWVRLAARIDLCKSDDDKKDYEELAENVMNIVDRLVHKTDEKIEQSTDVLKAIISPVMREGEEVKWPPKDLEALELMEKWLIRWSLDRASASSCSGPGMKT